MGQERTAGPATLNNTWQNIGDLVAAAFLAAGAYSDSPSAWKDVTFRVPTASLGCRVALTQKTTVPTSDLVSILIAPGEFRVFSLVDFSTAWVKSPGGVSILEITGSPE